MTGYHVSDLARDYRAAIPPEVCYVILHHLSSAEGIRKMFRAIPDPLARQRVNDAVNAMLTGAKIHTDHIQDLKAIPEATSAPLTPETQADHWLPVAEVAKRLGVTRRSVVNYIQRGDLNGRKKDGKSWEVERSSVQALDAQANLDAA